MSSISYVLTVVPVSDLGQAIDFYTKLLGRPPELQPMEGVAEWQIGGSAWIQVSTGMETVGSTRSASRSGRSSTSVWSGWWRSRTRTATTSRRSRRRAKHWASGGAAPMKRT